MSSDRSQGITRRQGLELSLALGIGAALPVGALAAERRAARPPVANGFRTRQLDK